MKRRQHPVPKNLLLIPGLLVAVFCVVVPGYLKLTGNVRMEEPDDNPDKFHLWTTNSSYGCSFIYDPHAADAWLFRTGVHVNTNRP